MRTISAQQITDTVARLCIEANTRLPRDVQEALDKARAEEPWPLAKNTLDLLWSNLAAAKEEDLPICQDTGMACVFVELGTDVHIDGSFEAAIHEGVRRGYTDGYLRKSIVADPLRRGNTGDNTPAAITVHLVDGDGCTITVAPKGFGSENMSRIQMLKPADGVEGFKKFVIETVRLAGSNPCPPLKAGDTVLLSGVVYTARDQAHKRMLEALDKGEKLPFDLEGSAIYYVGPTPERPGEVIGSAGPTTSGRMDAMSPRLLDLGNKIMIGKGKRDAAVKEAVVRSGAVYLAALGGAGALMAQSVKTLEVIAWPDLGCEAVRRLTVEKMPLTVILDAHGGDLYTSGPAAYLETVK